MQFVKMLGSGAAVSLAVLLGIAPGTVQAQVTYDAWFPGTSSITEEEVVPRAYRGRWAPSAAECDDQDGVERITILPNGINSYDSGGRLVRVTQSGQERSILLKIEFEGEGAFSQGTFLWSLNEKGDRLTITAANDDGSAKTSELPAAYYQCAASRM